MELRVPDRAWPAAEKQEFLITLQGFICLPDLPVRTDVALVE